jgi:hypothetical protein
MKHSNKYRLEYRFFFKGGRRLLTKMEATLKKYTILSAML